jgi:Flp pilus assembly protein TadG
MMLTRLRRARAARARGERGAALTEFALMLPILIMLAIGILEFGLGWRDSMTVSNTLRAGARVGSNAGNDRLADFNTIEAVESAIKAIPNTQILRLIIYKSTTANGSVPANCLSVTAPGGVNGSCNVYSAAQISSLTAADFTGTTCSGSAPDRYWCPTDRISQQASGADYLGVYLEVDHDYVTKLFPGGGITITDNAVMRLEPDT